MPFLRAVQSHLYIDSVVRQSRAQINIDRTFIKQPLELNGDAGDQYTGLDRFGRVSELNWFNTNTSASVDRYQYTFDRNSNRTRRDNVLNNNFSERYDYDNLGQLTTLDRANSIEKSWNYDALGNWESVTQGASTQTRTHNLQNEIISASGQTSPTYDLNGNQTRDFSGRTFTFDAWNRLVKVTPSGGGAPIREYEYDARFRRIEEAAGTTTTDFYYSSNWQVLEEHVDNTLESQFVWSPTYIDALILRDRNVDENSANGLEERLWTLQDANYNVTALVNSSGSVVERYAYEPFGSAQILDNSWNTRGSSAYSWDYLHQGLRYDAGIDKYHVRFRDYDPQSGRWLSMDPIGFAAGDVNLYRGVGNDFVGGLDPSGLEIYSEGVGHHYVPVGVATDEDIRPLLAKSALREQAGGVTGPLDHRHHFGKYGGIEHRDYNAYVKYELLKFMGKKGVIKYSRKGEIIPCRKLNSKEMLEFIENLKSGKNLEKYGTQIKKFNDSVLKHTANVKGPYANLDAAGRTKLGEQYMRSGRYAALAVFSTATTLFSFSTALSATAEEGSPYLNAIASYNEGNVKGMREALLGDETDPTDTKHLYGFVRSKIDLNSATVILVTWDHYKQVLQSRFDGIPELERQISEMTDENE